MFSVRTLLTGTVILGLGLLYLLPKNDSSQSLPLPVFFSADCHSQSSASVLFYPLHPHLTATNFTASFTTSTNLWSSSRPPTSASFYPYGHCPHAAHVRTFSVRPTYLQNTTTSSLADGWTQSLSKFGVDFHSLVFLCLYRRWRKPRWQRLKSTRLASTTGRLRRGLPYCTS